MLTAFPGEIDNSTPSPNSTTQTATLAIHTPRNASSLSLMPTPRSLRPRSAQHMIATRATAQLPNTNPVVATTRSSIREAHTPPPSPNKDPGARARPPVYPRREEHSAARRRVFTVRGDMDQATANVSPKHPPLLLPVVAAAAVSLPARAPLQGETTTSRILIAGAIFGGRKSSMSE